MNSQIDLCVYTKKNGYKIATERFSENKVTGYGFPKIKIQSNVRESKMKKKIDCFIQP